MERKNLYVPERRKTRRRALTVVQWMKELQWANLPEETDRHLLPIMMVMLLTLLHLHMAATMDMTPITHLHMGQDTVSLLTLLPRGRGRDKGFIPNRKDNMNIHTTLRHHHTKTTHMVSTLSIIQVVVRLKSQVMKMIIQCGKWTLVLPGLL